MVVLIDDCIVGMVWIDWLVIVLVYEGKLCIVIDVFGSVDL